MTTDSEWGTVTALEQDFKLVENEAKTDDLDKSLADGSSNIDLREAEEEGAYLLEERGEGEPEPETHSKKKGSRS